MTQRSSTIHIKATNLHRAFRIGNKSIEVLKGVDIEVLRGERLFLCGASGAGKTSLLYTLAGLERPNQGEVLVDGEALYSQPSNRQARVRNRQMGYVFQNYFLLPELTALENVMLPSMIGNRRSDKRAQALLERVGLSGRFGHLPAELSGGEQQRVAIARALINEPDIIFADEPTGNLDSRTGAEVMNVLLQMVADRGRTLIVVTHDAGLAKSGDRRLVLADGKLV